MKVKYVIIIMFTFLVNTLIGQRIIEGSLGFYNFHSAVLKNKTNTNTEIGKILCLGITIPILKVMDFNSNLGIGNLNSLGTPYKPYQNSNFVKLDLEFRIRILAKYTNIINLHIEPLLGYGITYLPDNKQYYDKNLLITVQPGIQIKYTLQKQISFIFQTSWNQRLDSDYRTFLSNKFTLGIPFKG